MRKTALRRGILDNNLVELHDLKIPNIKVERFTDEGKQDFKAFGYTYEEYEIHSGDGIKRRQEPLPCGC